MLCETCRAIFIDMPGMKDSPTDYYREHHWGIESLLESTEAHCQICVQLYANLQQHYWKPPDNTRSGVGNKHTINTEMVEGHRVKKGGFFFASEYYWDNNAGSNWYWTKHSDAGVGEKMKPLLTYQCQKTLDLAQNDHLETQITFRINGEHFGTSGYTSRTLPESYFHRLITLPSERVQQYTLASKQVFADPSDHTCRLNLAKGWLQDCLFDHTECRTDSSNWLPTRLLKIYGSGASHVKLTLTKLEPPAEQSNSYFTLSHRWGEAQFFQLTSHTLPQLLAGIDISVLPKTFQDAVKTTAFLGFQYLWIDSLCIIQDLIQDWKTESSRMGDVYINGVCNLAATGSDNADGGFWVAPPKPFDLKCLSDDPSLDQDSNLNWHTHSQYLEDAPLLLDGPLLSRGWVIQERFLARRAVHFGANQLFWDCRCFQACETYPRGLPPTMIARKRNIGTLDRFDSENRLVPLSSDDAEVYWTNVVEEYSKCNLKKPDDRLVAITGLCKKTQEKHPQFNFIAGMLRQRLERSLLWTTTHKNPRSTAYRAPSWSWASVDSSIRSYPGLLKPENEMCKTIEVVVEPGDDPMGQNVSATLRMEGYLMTVGVYDTFDFSSLAWSKTQFRINGVWYRESLDSDLRFKLRDADEPFLNMHCLIVFGDDYPPTKNTPYFHSVLIQPTGVKKGQFRRYGIYGFLGEEFKLLSLDDLKNVQNEEWLEYESVGEDGKCIVSIV